MTKPIAIAFATTLAAAALTAGAGHAASFDCAKAARARIETSVSIFPN